MKKFIPFILFALSSTTVLATEKSYRTDIYKCPAESEALTQKTKNRLTHNTLNEIGLDIEKISSIRFSTETFKVNFTSSPNHKISAYLNDNCLNGSIKEQVSLAIQYVASKGVLCLITAEVSNTFKKSLKPLDQLAIVSMSEECNSDQQDKL